MPACEKVISIKPKDSGIWYNKSCTYSLKGNVDKAIECLRRAIELDFEFKENAKEDIDFDNIRSNPEFRKLVYDE